MLKRHLPLEAIDSVNTKYFLPIDYIGASVNVFVNGVLYTTEGIEDHPFGFYVDLSDNSVNFYTPLYENDSLFLLYDSDGNSVGAGNFRGKGSIEVEANEWQLCAIPVTTGIWENGIFSSITIRSTFANYVVSQLESKYNTNIGNLIELANTKVGDNSYFYNYIPNITPDDSDQNFFLTYIDDDNDSNDNLIKYEVTGFWIKSIADFPLIIDWEVIS